MLLLDAEVYANHIGSFWVVTPGLLAYTEVFRGKGRDAQTGTILVIASGSHVQYQPQWRLGGLAGLRLYIYIYICWPPPRTYQKTVSTDIFHKSIHFHTAIHQWESRNMLIPTSPTPLSMTKRFSFSKLHVVLKAQLMRLPEKAIEPGLVLIAIEVIINYFDFMYEVLHRWKRTL